MKPYLGNMTLCWLCGSFISDFGFYTYNHFQYPCKLGTLYAKSYIYIRTTFTTKCFISLYWKIKQCAEIMIWKLSFANVYRHQHQYCSRLVYFSIYIFSDSVEIVLRNVRRNETILEGFNTHTHNFQHKKNNNNNNNIFTKFTMNKSLKTLWILNSDWDIKVSIKLMIISQNHNINVNITFSLAMSFLFISS